MEAAETYRIEYVAPAIVRRADHQFCLEYIDAQGSLILSGFEKYHASGGLLYFPDAVEWNYYFPERKGQREIIQSRLIEWVLKEPSFRYLAPSLADGNPYRRADPAMSVLKPPRPRDPNRELSPEMKMAVELIREGNKILKQKGVPHEEMKRAVELMRTRFLTGFGPDGKKLK